MKRIFDEKLKTYIQIYPTTEEEKKEVYGEKQDSLIYIVDDSPRYPGVTTSPSEVEKYLARKNEIEENNQKFLKKYGKRFRLIIQ